jgi:tetratricopeptide (TPR) repeat protein
MLSRALNMETTIAFTGAGLSAPLGYPTWRGFVERTLEHTISEVNGRPSHSTSQFDVDRLNRLRKQLSPEQKTQVKPEQFLFIVGACRRTLEGLSAVDSYFNFLHETFASPNKELALPNPYDALLDLPIYRFITTNYDGELEQALLRSRNRDLSEGHFGLHRSRPANLHEQRDFTQEPQYHHQLALFALARVRDAHNMVFHCHGHYNHPKSMIVTESDYQRWYLNTELASGTGFRQTIKLLFNSNPILFIGYGLGDDDLLRPLRFLAAVDPHRKHSRPAFAILREESPGSDEDMHEFLYERYGVHVIPYSSKGDIESRTRGLCELLAELKERQGRWWTGWIQKPYFRKVEMPAAPPEPYRQHAPIARTGEAYAQNRLEQVLQELQQRAEAGARVIVLLGDGGTGKSWCAMQLLDKLRRGPAAQSENHFDGYFFWSSYYTDDSLVGLDTVLAYLDKTQGVTANAAGNSAISRLDRLQHHLRTGRHLIVFDGFERFLIPDEKSGFGVSSTPLVVAFLKAIASQHNKSTVVLTTRLWPAAYDESAPQAEIEKLRLPPFTTEDIKGVPPFSWVYEKQASSLCALMKGHVYALVLAAALIRRAAELAETEGKNKEDAAIESLSRLLASLAGVGRDGYIERMIRESIKVLDETWHGLAQGMLERISVFMRPVPASTIDICFDLALREVRGAGDELKAAKDALMEALVSTSLVQKVSSDSTEPDGIAYTVHPIVRGYIYKRVHEASTDNAPSLTLPGYTAANAIVDPGGPRGVRVVTELLDRLCDEAESACDAPPECNAPAAQQTAKAIAVCRSAFSVLRARTEMNTAARWTTFNDYFCAVARIANAAKRISPLRWDFQAHDRGSVETSSAPLYADEVAWIYNELGLACYAEGNMLDTLAIWERGSEINSLIDTSEEGGQYLFQSECNLGAAYIHFGHLPQAASHLHRAEEINSRLNDVDHKGRILGYLALIDHLKGNLQDAEAGYDTALKYLGQVTRNRRAESVFRRHYGDLKIKQEDYKAARNLIDAARSLAQVANYPELIASARLSEGHWHRRQKQFPEAMREYMASLEMARKMGMRRLESEALSELARLAYDWGDAQLARQRAIESLAIANELLLGLRQTHDLVVLGLATLRTGPQDLGAAYLRHAKRLADSQNYFLRSREAERQLSLIGEPT